MILKQGCQTFLGVGDKRPQPLLQATCLEITVSGVPNCLNCYVIFMIYIQFTNVATVGTAVIWQLSSNDSDHFCSRSTV